MSGSRIDPGPAPAPASAGTGPVGTLPIVSRRRPGVTVAAVVAVLLCALVVRAFVDSPNINWSVVKHYLGAETILIGAVLTLVLTAASMLLGSVVGLIVAQMRLSGNRVLGVLANGYLFFFRGVPVLVQLVFWFNLALLFPSLSIGIPFTDLTLVETDTNRLITPFVAAILGLGLAEGAYLSEVFRAGLLSVDKGQTEAAASLGMRSTQITRRIVLPQAMRIIIPPVGNETIGMLKNTALVTIIAASELFTRAQVIYSRTYEVVELLIVITFWYLVMTTVLSILQAVIERRFGRGFGSERMSIDEGPLARLFGRPASWRFRS